MQITAEGPTGHIGAALLPVPARLGMAYQSWGEVVGEPGTAQIPAPHPCVPQDWNRALHRSSDAPDIWTPGIYYQPKLAAPPNVAIESDNQMPVPAVSPRAQVAMVAKKHSLLRQQQVGWPITTPSFDWRNR
jgi:hypothetical protein